MGHLRKVPVMGGTKLRLGGSTQGEPDNAIGSIPAGNYTAIAQAAGQRVWDDQHRNTNFWWVLIDTPQGRGWINAVLINEGGNNQKIDRVPTARTVFGAPHGMA